MEIVNKKHAVALGLRIGTVFLTAVVIVILTAYFVLSQNFQTLLTDYSIKLVEAMTDQGVKMVETELEIGRQEVSFLANSFQVPSSKEEKINFPQPYTEGGHLRMTYVTDTEIIASDGSQREVRERQDVRAAFAGEISVYGPYFNEDNEFVICYTAPVKVGSNIAGVLSIEKDGYKFCEMIENIRFVDSGECYIINGEGTDIAVSDKNHIDWVNSQYNAQKIIEEEGTDDETRSILELEQKGLNGETGLGTYYWEDGLVYVFYKPIPSVGWVLLAGMREEEMASMTQSTLFASISKGPVLAICLFLVLVLTALIMFWIISSMKKNAEINEKLKIIANYDSLSGLNNRNSYHAALDNLFDEDEGCLGCVYLDVNGLHELNNHFGHQAGDQMLKAVADALRTYFPKEGLYRIGGDEFVVLSRKKSKQELHTITDQVRQSLGKQNYEVSMGIAWREDCRNAADTINQAEAEMQRDKQHFYQSGRNTRRMRAMDIQLEQLIMEKQDADTFLEFLAPEFKGVYFVNLSRDTVRHLYIPPYFEDCLRETDGQFCKALLLYARKIVKPEYFHQFEEICDYAKLRKKLKDGHTPEFVYQKLDGEWLKLRILKFRDYTDEQMETLWIFSNTDEPDSV